MKLNSRSVENLIPSVRFSEKIQNELASAIRTNAMVRLLSGGLGYNGLVACIKSPWKPKGGYRIVDLENEYYLVRFDKESDYHHALLDGLWLCQSTYLTVQPWHINFSTKQTKSSSIAAWVRLPGLPFRYYNKSAVKFIGSLIGKVLKIDFNTKTAGRGKFVRRAVKLDLCKPITPYVLVKDELQRVQYESLPILCYNCGVIGHLTEKYSKAKPTPSKNKENTTTPANPLENTSASTGSLTVSPQTASESK